MSRWIVPEIMKMCWTLSKLCLKYYWFLFFGHGVYKKTDVVAFPAATVLLVQRFPTFFISFPIWCRHKVAVSLSYNHLIFASFSQPGGASWAPAGSRRSPGRKRSCGMLSVAERLWLKENQIFCETFIMAIHYTNSDCWGQCWKLLPRSWVNIARGRRPLWTKNTDKNDVDVTTIQTSRWITGWTGMGCRR